MYTDPDGEWIIPALVVIGSYLGGAAANKNKDSGTWGWNPLKWDLNFKTLGGVVGGAALGYLGGSAVQGLFVGTATLNVGFGNAFIAGGVQLNLSGAGAVIQGLGYTTAAGGGILLLQSQLSKRKEKGSYIDMTLVNNEPAGQWGMGFDEIPLNPAIGMGKRIAEIANGYVGSTDYNLLSKKDDFLPGNPKCNKFVYDVLLQAGASPGLPNQPGRWGMPGSKPPIAVQWANTNYNIPGWVVVSSPMPGDIASFNGHVGIVFVNGLTISATLRDGVVRNDWGFRAGQTPVFRRFVGYSSYY